MLRIVAVSALVMVSSCKDETAATVDQSPAPAAKKADPAKDEPATAPDKGEAKTGPGLAGAVEKAVDDAKASQTTLLIPDVATVVAGADITAFVGHPLFESLETRLGSRPREQLQAATRCGVGPDKWRTFVIGIDPAGHDMAMVATAVGLGKKATLECLAKEIGTFTLSEDSKTMSDHTGGGIVLDDDAVAFATPAWMSPLRERIDGKGKAAADGPLKAVMDRTDSTKPLWFAGLVPVRQREMASGTLGSEPSDLAGHLDLAGQVALQLTVAVPDPKAAQQKLHMQWNLFKGMATGNGVPQAVADSVKFGQVDGAVSLELSASNADIENVLTKFFPSRG